MKAWENTTTLWPRHLRIMLGKEKEFNCTIEPGSQSIEWGENCFYTFELVIDHYVYEVRSARVLPWDYHTGLLVMLPSYVTCQPEYGWMEVEVEGGKIELREIAREVRQTNRLGMSSPVRFEPKLNDNETCVWRVGLSVPLIVRIA